MMIRYLVGALEARERLEDAVDERLVRVRDALLQAEQRLQMGVRQKQLPVANQLRGLAQLGGQRVHKVRHQARTAVLGLHEMARVFRAFKESTRAEHLT